VSEHSEWLSRFVEERRHSSRVIIGRCGLLGQRGPLSAMSARVVHVLVDMRCFGTKR
jgi:hypothetical protein